MNKAIKQSYRGMNYDITKSKFSNEFYFEGKNIRIIATDSQTTGSVTNEKGNSLIFQIPNPIIDYTSKIITYGSKTLSYLNNEINHTIQSGNQVIIGQSTTRDHVILFTTDDNGFDCIWSVQYDNYDLKLLYLRDLNFSTSHPIQCLNNFENSNIDKIYWVNGVNQLQFLNIKHSVENQDLEELIDLPVNVIDMVGKYNLSEPAIIKVLSGGTHTSGMIQYAYNLYRLNSAQTKLSPLSELIPLDKKNLGGGAVNESVGAIPVVKIDDIDTTYTNIRVYSIKYTSYNETPAISLIDDRKIPSSGSIQVFDDNTPISTVSLEEFMFMGSDIIIPKHITSKFNRLFLANYNELNFDVKLDTRAYSFPISSTSVNVYNNIVLDGISGNIVPSEPVLINTRQISSSFTDLHEDTFDSINLNYDVNRYAFNSLLEGGEGKYLKYELFQSTNQNPDNRYFKDNEIYRLGVEFFNVYGQVSLPKWVADFKAPSGNLNGNFNILKVELKPDFFTWLNNSSNFEYTYNKPVGYRVLIAERTLSDRTIVANGALGTMMVNDRSSRDVPIGYKSNPTEYDYVKTKTDELVKLPNFLLRNCNDTSFYGNTQPLQRASHLSDMNRASENSNTEVCRAYYGNRDTSGRFYQFNSMLQLYSPEIIFKESLSLTNGLELKIKGAFKNTYNAVWAKRYEASTGSLQDEVKALNGIIPAYAEQVDAIFKDPYAPLDYGIICHPGGSSSDRVTHSKFYRGYGNINVTDTYTNVTISEIYNPFTTVTLPDTNNYIRKYGNGVAILTRSLTFHKANISYTVTPNLAHITEPYTITVTSDNEGNNALITHNVSAGSYTIVVPTQINPFTALPASDIAYSFKFYLKITTPGDVLFTGSVDCSANIKDDADVLLIDEISVNNAFTINTVSTNSVNAFMSADYSKTYNIYGTPEVTEKGQSFTTYNDDPNYRYTNSFQSIYTDGDSSWKNDGVYGRRIISSNSENNRCVTFVTGPKDINTSNDSFVRHYDRNSLEDLFTMSDGDVSGENNLLIGELVKTKNEIYLGGIYGGNSYEEKQRTNYLEIGEYKKLTSFDPVNTITSPGDTFVNNFRFLRVVKKDENFISEGIIQQEEIVEFLTETSINLKNRNDTSDTVWDAKFFNINNDYHEYNKVYSQASDLIKRRNLNYNFKKISSYDTNIIASKLKSAGELIDNWTDILQNEVMTLNGKFGAINSLISFQDEVYVIQDKAFAYVSISPRIQTQGSDGLAIQLGTGNILDRYKYVSTENGTRNKFGVVVTEQGVYFFDVLNKAFTVFKGQLEGLSDTKSMHSFFINNIVEGDLMVDNPVLKKGISCGYDYINNDVMMTFHQNQIKNSVSTYTPYTISFNENTGSFVSFYDYTPSFYISRGNYFITTNPDNRSIYRQGVGQYNTFYGVKYPSYIILNVNPAADFDCVFDNINFKSEVYSYDALTGLYTIDNPDKTLTGIRAYTDYLDSNTGTAVTPLISGRNNNLRRKFRDWNALIPRAGRQRIRGPWVKLKLVFDQQEGDYKFVLHDTNIFYTI
jgi:hypothetical protein